MSRVSSTAFHTKAGWLTRYGLACGYIEKRGTDESYIVLEQISSNGTLGVQVSGKWYRGISSYTGPDLKTARRVFRKTDHKAMNEAAEREYMARLARKEA